MKKSLILIFISLIMLVNINYSDAITTKTILLSSPIEDTYVHNLLPNEPQNYPYLWIQNSTLPINKYTLDYTLVKFDISSIPQDANILSAKISLYLAQDYIPSGTGWNVKAYRISNQIWDEHTTTWNNRPLINLVIEDTLWFDSNSIKNIYYSWDITNALKTDYNLNNNNFSIGLIPTDRIGTISGTTNYLSFRSKEYLAFPNPPTLTIIYTTPSNPIPSKLRPIMIDDFQ